MFKFSVFVRAHLFHNKVESLADREVDRRVVDVSKEKVTK